MAQPSGRSQERLGSFLTHCVTESLRNRFDTPDSEEHIRRRYSPSRHTPAIPTPS